MTHKVRFTPEARDDLLRLYVYIAERGGDARALTFVESIEDYCLGFKDFPERGRRRDDLVPGERIIGFRRRATIAFRVEGDTVIIDRIAYRGRDLAAWFKTD